MQQFLQPVEGHAEALLDGAHPQGHHQVSLAHPRRALHQQRRVLPDEGAGGQRLDLPAFDRRLEAEVEVAQGHPRRQVGQFQRGLDTPLVAGADLAAQQPVQHHVRRPVVLDRLGQFLGQGLRRVGQPQSQQLLAEAIHLRTRGRVARPRLRCWRAHRLTSASAAYRSRGRCSTGISRISCKRWPIRPKGSGAATRSSPGPS